MQELSESSFDTATATGTVLIDFSATWCGPCKALSPILERMAKEYDGRLQVYKIDVDEAQSVAARHGVMSLPTLVLFKEGRAVDRKIGSVREQDLRSMIDSHLENGAQ